MNGRAAKSPCQACPWRVENHGKRHPDGWYTKANLRRLWSGIRRGEEMSCHPTDPSNPVSERAQERLYAMQHPRNSISVVIGGATHKVR